MNILITGAKGFVGRNLTENLKTIRDGKNRTRNLKIDEIYEYDIDTDPALLKEFCQKADFVFNLAGVNRPQNQEEFMQGNFGFASTLLDTPEIIQENATFFSGTECVTDIFVIGHSLSEVDYPYFTEIVRHNSNKAFWHIGYHSLSDFKNLLVFVSKMGIKDNCFEVFRT